MWQIEFVGHRRTLERQRLALERLVGQIAKYEPRLPKREVRRREAARKRLYRLNPHHTKSTIDQSIATGFDPRFQWERRFGQRLMDAWTVIILVSAAVVEESINSYLAMKCVAARKEELFDDLEKVDLLKKWLLLPSLFVPTYSFPKGGRLFQDLKLLSQYRNALAHPKIAYLKDGKRLLDGTGTKRKGYRRDIEFLRACCSLPERLIGHLRDSDKSYDTENWLVILSSV